MDGGAWWAAVHGVAKSQTGLSDFTFTFHFHALEKEMATHSSVLAWKVPGTHEKSSNQSLVCFLGATLAEPEGSLYGFQGIPPPHCPFSSPASNLVSFATSPS